MPNTDNVDFTRYAGAGDIDTWLAEALLKADVPATDAWLKGMRVLCERESSFRPNAVNDYDSNATGAKAADGYKFNCSRGIAQCIPSTFARFHVNNTSWQIYDPVANIAAAVAYIMSRYKVANNGSDLAKKVQQADKSRSPHGYKKTLGPDSWIGGQSDSEPGG